MTFTGGEASARRSRASRLPAICPTEAQIVEAQDFFNGRGLAIDARLEAEKFRNHHIGKGTLSKSWPHNWATWRLRAAEFYRPPSPSGAARHGLTYSQRAFEGRE